MRRSLVLVALGGVVLSGCFFDFPRGVERRPGDIEGRALRADDGEPAPFARVEVQGGALLRRARANGLFVVSGLGEGAWTLRLVDDPDGDGEADRVAWRAATVRSQEVAGKAQLAWVLLGDVLLEGTARVTGTLASDDGSPLPPGARVYVFRQSADLSPAQLAGTAVEALADRTLGAEAEAPVPSDEAFDLGGFAPGPVKVIAFHPGTEERGALVSDVVALTAAPGETVDAGVLTLRPASATRRVLVDVHFDPPLREGDAYDLTLVPAGRPRAEAASIERHDAPATVELELPVGAWDVYLDSAPGSRSFHGVLLSQLAWAPQGDEPEWVRWGALRATPLNPCGDDVGPVDRDGDGVRGLPRRADAPEVWGACAAPCAAAVGTAADDVVCRIGDIAYDCDDDADGQPDTLEGGCLGVCAGTDLDEDGRCDRGDAEIVRCTGPDCGADEDAGVVTDGGASEPDAGPPAGCDAAEELPPDGRATGSLVGARDDLEACFATGSGDALYRFHAPGRLHDLSASLAGSGFDTLLSVYGGSCDVAGRLGCNDDAVGASSAVSVSDVPAGDVHLVVEGYQGAAGDYALTVSGRYALGEPCDPALPFLSCVSGSCELEPDGSRRCTGPRDCADGVDADDDGAADEDEGRCTTPPVLSCPASVSAPVLEPVTLTASASDDGSVAFRRWSLVSAPLGASVTLANAASDEVSFTPLLAGSYLLRYLAADDEGQLSACLVPLEVTTDDVFRVELVWNVDVALGDPTDLDLHLLHPLASRWFDPALDCHFENCRNHALSWQEAAPPLVDAGAFDAGGLDAGAFDAGALDAGDLDGGTVDGGALDAGTADGGPPFAGPDPSPSLDIDDVDGRGPENINIAAPELGAPYRVGVHYFADDGYGAATAYVNVFCHGQLAATFGPATLRTAATPDEHDFWKVADVVFTPDDCAATALSGADGGPLVVTRAEAASTR